MERRPDHHGKSVFVQHFLRLSEGSDLLYAANLILHRVNKG